MKSRRLFSELFSHSSYTSLLIIGACLLLTMYVAMGCSSSTPAALDEGALVDSAVAGIEYKSADRSGLTDDNGVFYFEQGDQVTFSIGGMPIGDTVAASYVMGPIDLVDEENVFHDNERVTNIARFLQTLDQDGDPGNGILLTPAIRDQVQGMSIDFGQSPDAFEADPEVADLLNRLNQYNLFTADTPRSLRSAGEAQTHLLSTMAENNLSKIAVINLGDDFTIGTQSGFGNVNDGTQTNSFPETLTTYMMLAASLTWYNPLLDTSEIETEDGATESVLVRADDTEVPYNLGVDGATVYSLIHERTGSGDDLLDELMQPLPGEEYAAGEVSQLEAAEYVAGLNTDKYKIFTIWIGANDVFGALFDQDWSNMTTDAITAFLNDTTGHHDLESVTAGLSEIVSRLTGFDHGYVFIANLPPVSAFGALLTPGDLESLATFEDAAVTSLPEGSALGFGPFLSGSDSLTSVAYGLSTDNASLNQFIGTVAATDGNVLSPEEATLIDARVDAVNAHIDTLVAAYDNVFLVDLHTLFTNLAAGPLEIPLTDSEAENQGEDYETEYIARTLGAGFYSADGYHPSQTGGAYVATAYADAINQAFAGIDIGDIMVKTIWDYEDYHDNDGDGFPDGPVSTEVAISLMDLLDCDDDDASVLPPYISGAACN